MKLETTLQLRHYNWRYIVAYAYKIYVDYFRNF